MLNQGGDVLKRLIPLAALAGLISLAAIGCGGDSEPAPTSQPSSPPPPPAAPAAAARASAPGSAGSTGGGTAVTVVNRDMGGSGEYRFDPNELTFKVGETVDFTVISQTEFHTFTVDDLGIDQAMNPGERVSFTYTFDTPGTFQLICIPHEALGMVGTITVQ